LTPANRQSARFGGRLRECGLAAIEVLLKLRRMRELVVQAG
jgi:hypothetical protein